MRTATPASIAARFVVVLAKLGMALEVSLGEQVVMES
jgi:hypothetical protein